jgi:hypothetical protein
VEVGDCSFCGESTCSRGIEVLDSQNDAAAGMSRGQPGNQEGAGVAQMQAAGGGGGETANDNVATLDAHEMTLRAQGPL